MKSNTKIDDGDNGDNGDNGASIIIGVTMILFIGSYIFVGYVFWDAHRQQWGHPPGMHPPNTVGEPVTRFVPTKEHWEKCAIHSYEISNDPVVKYDEIKCQNEIGWCNDPKNSLYCAVKYEEIMANRFGRIINNLQKDPRFNDVINDYVNPKYGPHPNPKK